MAKEKNIIIAFVFVLLFPSALWAATVCTTYEGKRLCGNSLVLETKHNEFSACTKTTDTCKKLIITNSHLTSGSNIEICDDQNKCSSIDKKNVLNDVINDVAVFQIAKTSSVKTNGVGVRLKSGPVVIYSFQHKQEDGGHTDPFSNKELSLKKASSDQSLLVPQWVSADVKEGIEGRDWKGKDSNIANFVVARGMSGSALMEMSNELDIGSIAKVKGLVTGHHNFLPITNYVKLENLQKVGDEFFTGKRGLSSDSEKLGAQWHYSPEGATTYRSLRDGKLWETGILNTPSGGGTVTDTGGGTITDTGGGTVTDTGESCLIEVDKDLETLKKIKKHFSLYVGVMIDDKQVIGLRDKKSGRILFATWELLTEEDVSLGEYKNFTPYYESEFSPQELLQVNRAELIKHGQEKFCLAKSSDCVELRIKESSLIISTEVTKTEIKLDGIRSTDLFKNIPLTYPSGEKSTIWLADIFLPDQKLDSIRDSKTSITGGNHSTGRFDVLKKK